MNMFNRRMLSTGARLFNNKDKSFAVLQTWLKNVEAGDKQGVLGLYPIFFQKQILLTQ